MRAHDVERFDDDLARLVERMTRLMVDASGVGLAANQVGVLRRVLVLQAREDEPAKALVNPRIVERSDATAVADEGCLSLQGVLVPVERAVNVTVEGHDVSGRPVKLELHDLGARVFQHELDHLDGVLVVDRTTADARREALAVLRPRTIISAV